MQHTSGVVVYERYGRHIPHVAGGGRSASTTSCRLRRHQVGANRWFRADGLPSLSIANENDGSEPPTIHRRKFSGEIPAVRVARARTFSMIASSKLLIAHGS